MVNNRRVRDGCSGSRHRADGKETSEMMIIPTWMFWTLVCGLCGLLGVIVAMGVSKEPPDDEDE